MCVDGCMCVGVRVTLGNRRHTILEHLSCMPLLHARMRVGGWMGGWW